MSTLEHPSSILYRQFRDVDAFSQAFYAEGLSLTQLESGRFEGLIAYLILQLIELPEFYGHQLSMVINYSISCAICNLN